MEQQLFFYLVGLKMELPKNQFLIFFKLNKLVEDYHLLLPSKPLEGDFCCLENIDFWPLKLSQFLGNILTSFFLKKSEITHSKGILLRKIKINTKKLQQKFWGYFFLLGLIWCGITP
jgi:hypothetical protein